MHKKIIGIPGWVVGDLFGVRIPYIQYFEKFGKVIILTPQHHDTDLDLLVLPGGADVDPQRYGHAPHYKTGSPNTFLEFFDNNILPRYIESNTPIVGICRGLQSACVHFGGTMDQHLPNHAQSFDQSDIAHGLHFVDKYKKWSKLLKEGVNSRHHQCVETKDLPSCMEVVAFAKEDKKILDIPEIVIHKTKPIYLIQSHPEDNEFDELTPFFVESFLNQENPIMQVTAQSVN